VLIAIGTGEIEYFQLVHNVDVFEKSVLVELGGEQN
jgi:hypothetical protein